MGIGFKITDQYSTVVPNFGAITPEWAIWDYQGGDK